MRTQLNKSELRSFLIPTHPSNFVPEGLSGHNCLSKSPTEGHQVKVLKITLVQPSTLEEEITIICGAMKLNILLAKAKENDTYKVQSL